MSLLLPLAHLLPWFTLLLLFTLLLSQLWSRCRFLLRRSLRRLLPLRRSPQHRILFHLLRILRLRRFSQHRPLPPSQGSLRLLRPPVFPHCRDRNDVVE